MKMQVFHDDGSITSLVDKLPNVYRVKRDQDTLYQFSPEDRLSNGVRKEAATYSPPAVMNTGELDGAKNWQWARMSESVQRFWVDILSMHLYGRLFNSLSGTDKNTIITDFKGLTKSDKFLTNGNGTDLFHNYITGENIGKIDPKQAPLICCDDWVRVLQIQTNKFGIKMGQLDSFLYSEILPPVTPSLLYDPRILWATVINKYGNIGNFPQLNGKPVPYPYITAEHYWYPLDDLVLL